jgi:hypothetical protein
MNGWMDGLMDGWMSGLVDKALNTLCTVGSCMNVSSKLFGWKIYT